MAVITKEDLIKKFNSFAGENATDEALSFLEDLTDTVSDFEAKTKDTTDWEAKYRENDAAWRNRYKARFNDPTTEEPQIVEPSADPAEVKTYDELFKQG